MDEPAITWELDGRGVGSLTLNRPRVNNAYNAELVQAVLAALDALAARDDVRVLVLRGAGRHFQAGADLAWLNDVASVCVRALRLTCKPSIASITRLVCAMAFCLLPRACSFWAT